MKINFVIMQPVIILFKPESKQLRMLSAIKVQGSNIYKYKLSNRLKAKRLK